MSQQFCQNTPASPLTISVDDVNATFQWYSNTVNSNTGGTPILGATSSSFTPSSSNAGTFFYYCIISGCSNLTSDVAEVIVNPNPTAMASFGGSCGGNSYPLTVQANVPSTFYYCCINSYPNCPFTQYTYSPSTNETLSINSPSSTIYTAGQGPYNDQFAIVEITPISQYGCVGSTVYSYITFGYQLYMPALNNIEICSGDNLNVVLNNSYSTTYNWSAQSNSNVTGESSSQNTNVINDVLINTTSVNQVVTYTVTPYSSSTFCGPVFGQPTTFSVTVKPAPILNVSDVTICGGSTVQLIGNGTPSGGAYLWSGSGLSSPTNQQSQITVSPTTTTSYSASYTVNGCTTSDNVNVTVNQVNFDFHVNINPCGTTLDTLTAYVNIPGGVLSTSEIPGYGFGQFWSADQNIPNLEQFVTFTYILNGCSYSDSVYVDSDHNFISDEVIDTTIHPCQSFGLFEIPKNDYWDDSDLNSNYEYIEQMSSSTTDFVHFTNYPNGYNNTTLIGYTESTNGCLVDTVNITFDNSQNFFADTSGNNWIYSCGENAVQLNGIQINNADSMVWTSWYNGYSGNFNNSSNLNALYYPDQADYDQGFVILTLQAFYPHCLFPDTSDLYISLGTNVYTGNDTTICAHSPIVINSSGVNSTVWNSGNVDGDIVVLDSGNYQFIVTGYSGYNNFCISTDTLNILVNALPNIDAGLDFAICFGDSALLNASSNSLSNITWSNGEINLSYFNPLTSQSLIASVTENNCSNSDTVNILVNSNPQVNAGSDVFICEGDSVVLQGAGATFLEWTNSILNGVPFVPNQSDTFVLNGEDTNGCIGVDSLTISVYPHSDTTIIESSIGNYTWDVNNQTYSESGVYTGVVTNQFGCDSTITLNLTITTSSLEDSFGFTIVEIYPNPVVSQLNVVVDQSSIDSEYTITDMSGKIIMKGTVNAKQFQIDMSRLENGSYLIGVGGKLKVLVKQG